MAVVNEVVTRFGFEGDLKPQRDFNQGLTSSIKLLSGMAAGVTAAAGAMFAWASSVFDSLDPMVQLSRETGVAIEAIQELGFAADTNGSSLDAVSASLREVTKRVGEFEQLGGGPAKDVVEQLGVSFRDANGEIKSADQVMLDLMDTMQGMSQAERFSVLDKMGIDQSLVQMLSLSGDEMDSLTARARRLGIVTQEQADAVADYNTSLGHLKFGMQGIQNMVAVGFAPAMGDLVERFVELLEANHDLIVNGLTWLGDVVTSTAGMLQRMWPVFAAIAAGFVIAKIAAIGFGGVMSVVLSPVVLITAALVAAILIIDDLIVAFQGGESVIADFFESFFGIDIRPALQAIVAAVMWMIDLIMDLFAPAVDAIMHLFDAIVAVFTGDFTGALDSLGAAFESWVEYISGLFGALWDGVKNMWGAVVDHIKTLAMDMLPDWAIKLLGGAADVGSAVADGAGRAVDAVSGAASSAWDAVSGWWGGDDAETASALTAGFDRNEAVDRGSTQQSWNSSIDQNVEIHIATNDPQRAGAAVQDALQQQLKDSRTMSNRGGM